MFARLLLLIAIMTGLVAGPSALGGWCGVNVASKSCDCCVIPAEVTCCEAPSGPAQRVPVSSESSSQGQVKLAIQPLVTLLPTRLFEKTPVVNVPPYESVQASLSPLIDRICIRLI